MKYSLGFDFGTSAARASVIDRNLSIGTSRIIYVCNPIPLTTQSPIEWISALIQLTNSIPLSIRSSISRLSLDATSATCINLQDLNVLMYNSAIPKSSFKEFQNRIPLEHCSNSASSSLSKLLYWINLLQSDTTQQDFYFAHQADLLLASILGSVSINTDGKHSSLVSISKESQFPIISDWHNALKLGYDPYLQEYPDWMLNLISSSNKNTKVHLPNVEIPGFVIGKVSKNGVLSDLIDSECEVTAGTTDSIAAFLASGACREGDACTSLGSTLAIKMLSRTRLDNAQLGVYSHRFPDINNELWLIGGASNCGCKILRDLDYSVEEIESLSEQMNAEKSTNTNYYPLPLGFEYGERFPLDNPDQKCTVDITESNRMILLQGIFESIARIEAQGYATLNELGSIPQFPHRIFTSGGGSKNSKW
eukprot:CAMPEP_0182447344 /NCGR_PEP_ID=MMETSP1172-20130603/14882_1 /TAXON_ID=708627 /ORGANISM="Timspurckia oligopyrenoides, Strain CCMP3278" /LENGTH=421 /DNA_ID=CAMNT_0024643745 /DNA_START=189 /DNA_END=1451 /DNA_ORIENTATION=+